MRGTTGAAIIITTFTMLGEVGMANESTKTTQTSVRMAQHNERTRLHDLSCTPTNLRVH